MKFYEVTILKRGKREKHFIQATSKQDAATMVKANSGGVVLKTIETSPPLNYLIKQKYDDITTYFSRQKKVDTDEFISSLRQIAVMLDAGISIQNTLLEIVTLTKDRKLKSILKKSIDSINAGFNLSTTLKRNRESIGNLAVSMIDLGEKTGNLSESVDMLADILDDLKKNKEKFKKALRYPIITLVAMAIAFVVLIMLVVPEFKSIFNELGSDLPLPTQLLIKSEEIISNYGPYLSGGLVIFIFTLNYFYRTNSRFNLKVDKLLLELYLIGKIIYISNVHRYMLSFGTLLKAGIPIMDSLQSAADMIENSYLKQNIDAILISIQQGQSLSEAFGKSDVFENMVIQMIKAGEASGQLDSMIEKVANYYKSKFDNILDNISSYIEPIMMAFIAVFILLLALGIFMPMWDLASAVKGK